MKIFIAGAAGRVATELISLLLADGHEVVAGARSPERIAPAEHLTAVAMDLHDSPADLATLLSGVDAIYFTAGSRGKDLLRTDAMGAVQLMQAAEIVDIRRFILLSSVFADRPEMWHLPGLNQIMDYNVAKFFADHWLMRNTDLDWTILQPTALTEEPATGRVTFGITETGHNAIPNVAAVLAGLLTTPASVGKVITMSDGETPVREALASL